MKFSRQIRVIGRDGQKKLEAAIAIVPQTFDGEIARRYFVGAGVRVELGRQLTGLLVDPRFADMHPAAREVAVGAHYAASAIMDVVRS